MRGVGLLVLPTPGLTGFGKGFKVPAAALRIYVLPCLPAPGWTGSGQGSVCAVAQLAARLADVMGADSCLLPTLAASKHVLSIVRDRA